MNTSSAVPAVTSLNLNREPAPSSAGVLKAVSGIAKLCLEFYADPQRRNKRYHCSSKFGGGSFADGFRLTVGIEGLSYAANAMRQAMVRQPCQGANNPNCAGVSAGLRGDRRSVGGGRFDPSNPKALSPFGGQQGGTKFLGMTWEGRGVLGIYYKPGSWADRLVEAFAGPHDYLNSGYWYDSSGNIRQGMSVLEKGFGEALNVGNLFVAAPFVGASVMPSYLTPVLADY